MSVQHSFRLQLCLFWQSIKGKTEKNILSIHLDSQLSRIPISVIWISILYPWHPNPNFTQVNEVCSIPEYRILQMHNTEKHRLNNSINQSNVFTVSKIKKYKNE